MSTIRQLATEIEAGLRAAHPTLRKTVIIKLALAVGAVLEARTAEYGGAGQSVAARHRTAGYARAWLRRLLKNPLVSSADVLEPWARQVLVAACQHGEMII